MASKALLDQNPHPDLHEIQEGLKHNLCRCTGYVKIVDAISLAAQEMGTQKTSVSQREAETSARVGQSIPDYDAFQKVQGEPIFAGDLLKERMVFGKVLWEPVSPCPNQTDRHGEGKTVSRRESGSHG